MASVAGTIDRQMTTEPLNIRPASILAVIPTLNEARHIEACIRSLMTGEDGLRDVPLIVVDGGSDDGTLDIVEGMKAEFPNLQTLQNPKKLQAAAINLAVEMYASDTSDWLVRCDAHSIYPSNYILDVARSLTETRADSIVVPMDAVGGTCFEKANAGIVDTPLGSGGAAHRGGTASGYVDHGHHAGFAMEEFKRLGGYDESFSHNEDAEYDARLTANGGRIFLDADIRIQYIPRGSAKALARQYFNYGKGRAKNAIKHGARMKLRQLLPVFALLGILSSVLLAPVLPIVLWIPGLYILTLALASAYVMAKHKSVCGGLSGIALGVMHMSWAAGFIRHVFHHFVGRYIFSGGSENSGFGASPQSLVSSLGRRVMHVIGPLTGRSRASVTMKPANENYRIHRPVTRVTEVPAGSCVYAIGDIHGRFDLLETLIAKIESDVETLDLDQKPTIVFLGDYIDRGLQSRQIIDLFLGDRLADFETVYLMGNHEEALLNFLQDPNFGEKWAMYGGAETLFSYGLQPPHRDIGRGGNLALRDAWVTLWNQFRVSLPEEHLSFYRSLKLSHTIGDYIFVHAGLRPGIPVDQQREEDLLWIREEFLAASGDFEKLVVHGHTPSDSVYRDNRRIGLDTGAYLTGRLTAARFVGQEIDYLST